MSADSEEQPKKMRLDRRVRRALGRHYQMALRPLMPRAGWVRYSGVIVAEQRLGDRFAPKHWKPDDAADIPNYEAALMTGLGRTVHPGDVVVIVGGGVGVTAAHAASLAGERGRVVCFEGSPGQFRRVLRTAQLNGVGERVRVEFATVGAAIGVYHDEGESAAPLVEPGALPECDVLELDCEGAELQILAKMTIRPRVILVETHGMHGASAAKVRGLVEGLGYKVSDLGVAEPRLADLCERDDVRVLCGVRQVDVAGAATGE